MNIAKMLDVARWEFMEKAKTKAFILSLFLTPAIMLGFSIVPALLINKADTETKQFLIYDETGSLAAPLQQALSEKYTLPNGMPNYALVPVEQREMSLEEAVQTYSKRLLDDEFTGMFIVPKDILTSRRFEYRASSVGNELEVRKIGNELEKLVIERALVQQGIDPTVYNEVGKELSFSTIKVTKSGKDEKSGFMQVFVSAYGSTLILFLLVVITGQLLVRSLFEEKSNRIIEILLSSCSPMELMMGKLLGLSGLGLLQAGIWLGIGLGAGAKFGLASTLLPLLPFLLLYMVLGYLFYASILIGLGSLSTTEQEAQQITGYIAMLIMVPIVFLMPLMQNPNSDLVHTLSYIPFLTPSIMAMRFAVLQPAWWEILATVGIMVASILVLMYISSKIFRAAILSYGKRPTLPEIIGFLKEK